MYVRPIYIQFWIKEGNSKIEAKTRNTTTTLLHELAIQWNSRNKVIHLTIETRVSRQTRTVVLRRVSVHAESTMQTRTGVTTFHLHLTIRSYKIRFFKYLLKVWPRNQLSKNFYGFVQSLWINVWPITWNKQHAVPFLLLPLHYYWNKIPQTIGKILCTWIHHERNEDIWQELKLETMLDKI
jgi:hypothetical protein